MDAPAIESITLPPTQEVMEGMAAAIEALQQAMLFKKFPITQHDKDVLLMRMESDAVEVVRLNEIRRKADKVTGIIYEDKTGQSTTLGNVQDRIREVAARVFYMKLLITLNDMIK